MKPYDFNMTLLKNHEYYVKLSEIQEMIKRGVLVLDEEKLKEYKFDSTVSYDKNNTTREEAFDLWKKYL